MPKSKLKETNFSSKALRAKEYSKDDWKHDLYASSQNQRSAKYSDYYYSDKPEVWKNKGDSYSKYTLGENAKQVSEKNPNRPIYK